jgi:hypothetical protein
MNNQDIQNHRVESAVEHADALLQSAVLAAESFKDTHKLTSSQLTQMVVAHMNASVAFLNRGEL